MLEVQHLVIDDVINCEARHTDVIENLAYHDGIMCRIVMRQAASRAHLAPRHLRARQQSVKEADVELLEDLIQVIDDSPRRLDALAPAHLTHQMRLGADLLAAYIAAKASCLRGLYGVTINLGEQNMRNRLDNAFGRSFQQVRKPHV